MPKSRPRLRIALARSGSSSASASAQAQPIEACPEGYELGFDSSLEHGLSFVTMKGRGRT